MSKKLEEWDKQIPASLLAEQQRLNARRRFLAACAGTAALPLVKVLPVTAAEKADASWETQEPWVTLAAVQEHLFPSHSDAPGAKEIHATQYLKNVMEFHDVGQSEKDFIKNGVKWLDGVAKEQYAVRFINLSADKKEKTLRKIAQSRAGQNWISSLLSYIIEALLTSPNYGGNPGGIGWKWLQHQPGFPQPPTNKLYYRL